MDLKTEFIKSTISYIDEPAFSYLINIPDYSNNEHIIKYIIKIINKKLSNEMSICFVSNDINNFNFIFPNFQNNIKIGSFYSIGNHKLTFNILDKKFIKSNKDNFDILIFVPYENLKPKYITRLLDSIKSIKKMIIIGKNLDKTKFPYELKNMVHREFSFIPSESNTYYKFLNSRLLDIK